MMNLLFLQKRLTRLGITALFLLISVFNASELFSQKEKLMKQQEHKIDTLSKDLDLLDSADESEGINEKVLQALKFKENKARSEDERIQVYLEELNERNPKPVLDSSGGTIPFCRLLNSDSSSSTLDSIIKNDTIYYFRKCLQPKITVIGNHDFNLGENSQAYNFNYLTALNYKEYQLEPSGEINTAEILNDYRSSDILNDARATGCAIYLTIQNKNTAEISEFLHNSSAQKKFHSRLKSLLTQNKLQGIIINFQDILNTESDLFVKFIKDLRNLSSTRKTPVDIILSIPSLENKDSIEKVKAFDFITLIALVDHFLVRTENMVLYEDSNVTAGFETIASTIDFYTNGNIPLSKLIATVSWSNRDNPEYLTQKYTWILENNLGGIFIRDIDSSSKSLGLWETVRTELMEIGADIVDKKALELEKKPSMLFIISIVFIILGFIFFLWQYYKRR